MNQSKPKQARRELKSGNPSIDPKVNRSSAPRKAKLMNPSNNKPLKIVASDNSKMIKKIEKLATQLDAIQLAQVQRKRQQIASQPAVQQLVQRKTQPIKQNIKSFFFFFATSNRRFETSCTTFVQQKWFNPFC